MKGKYFLRIRNNRVSYDLYFNRCVTVIKGDSGTGKTNLISMLQFYIKSGKDSGIIVNTNIRSIKVLDDSTDWDYVLNKYKGSVFFADEETKYILTKEFVNLLYETGSYIVYFTRSGRTGYLQYSISSLCYFKSRRVDDFYINELFNLYNDENVNFKPDVIITEDSTSGLDMLSNSLNVEVVSSYGKDNIVNKLNELSKDYVNIYIFVDGAAFGNQISNLFSKIKSLVSCNVLIFAPESFEYLVLNTSKFKKFCEDELANTCEYVDNCIFKTWENYFEYLLSKLCKRYNHVKYEKVKWDELNPFFKKESLLKEITDQFKDLDADVKKFK